ncbi:MAG: hypothetical protein KF902_00715 [Phycisphaeraceae bacterium]|nr:hypothetical protein [Phycisphaeraceae bacterium]MCW5768700.1 hypothetical protein [Phycisphaeraceae bacterium]
MPRRLLAVIVACAGLSVPPAAIAQPVTSAFTYQGEIQKSGSPVTGNADLRFTLWDAASGGNQIGSQLNRDNVAVSGGVFTVSLDFGIEAYRAGRERFLQIELRSPAGSGSFVTLSTRQPLAATPYTVTALNGASPFVVQSPTNAASITLRPEGFDPFTLTNSTGNVAGGILDNSGGSVFVAYNPLATAVMYTGSSADQSGFIQLHTDTGYNNILIDSETPDFNQSGLIRLSSFAVGGFGGIYQATNNVQALTFQLKGGPGNDGADLRLFDAGTGATSIQIVGENAANVDGGAIRSLNASGHAHVVIEPDFSPGGGGYFALINPSFNSLVTIESNAAPGNNARFTMTGTSLIELSTHTTGDSSVVLPVDAVNSMEILNEPGLAHNQSGSILLTSTNSSVISRSITVPAPGYVLVLANGDIALNHTLGTGTFVEWYIDNVAGGTGSGFDDMLFALPANAPTGTYNSGAAAHAVFTLNSAGTFTYHLNMRRGTSGTATLFDVQFTVIYFPTAYGTVNPSLTGDDFRGSPHLGNNGPARMPQTPAEIIAERSQSKADDLARVQSELAMMRREMAEIRAMMLENPNVKAQKHNLVKAPPINPEPNAPNRPNNAEPTEKDPR